VKEPDCASAVTLPAGLATGTYYLIAKADADEVVTESQESNNTRFRTIAVGPDLIVSALTASSTAGAGRVLPVTETTRNQGGGGAGASVTRFYLSADYRLDGSDRLLDASRAVPALGAGAQSTATTGVLIPADTVTGAYFLLAAADDGGSVAETSETNNTRYVYIRVGPDLTVTSLSAPTTAPAGSTITMTDTTANPGGGDAGASTTRYYLSTNAVWDAGDISLAGGRVVAALAAGATSTGAASATIPAGVAPATYYLIAKADADEIVIEAFETNNTRFRSIVVTSSGQ